MRFTLLDRILRIEPGREIIAVKNLTLAEEYLAEHFPTFPVMPGVLMVEAATQAAASLVRVTERFQPSMVLLREARNLKFGQFVTPGQKLTVRCEWVKDDGVLTTLKVVGEMQGASSIAGRVVVERFNLADKRLSSRRTTSGYATIIGGNCVDWPAPECLQSIREWLGEATSPQPVASEK